jgi:hypothetical protein
VALAVHQDHRVRHLGVDLQLRRLGAGLRAQLEAHRGLKAGFDAQALDRDRIARRADLDVDLPRRGAHRLGQRCLADVAPVDAHASAFDVTLDGERAELGVEHAHLLDHLGSQLLVQVRAVERHLVRIHRAHQVAELFISLAELVRDFG